MFLTRFLRNVTKVEIPKIVNRLKYIPPSLQLDKCLVNKTITFKLTNGSECTVDAVIQDLMPKNGRPIATVIGMPGIPDSFIVYRDMYPYFPQHNIRFIGVTYPGQGYTAEQPGMTFDNIERNNYTQAVIDEMCPTGDIVLLGHSRGCEQAVGVTASLSSYRDVRGLVLINGTGFRYQTLAQPSLSMMLLVWGQETFPRWRSLWEELAMMQMRQFQWRTRSSPGQALTSFIAYMKTEFEKQIPYYDTINAAEKTQVVVGYAANDRVIPLDVAREAAEYWTGFTEIICEDASPEKDVETTDKAVEYIMNGTKTVALHYKVGGHSLPVERTASFVRCILALLKVDKY